MSVNAERFPELDEMLRWLDAVRETGGINMFGAALPLAEMYGLSKPEAREILAYWMETFEKRQSA